MPTSQGQRNLIARMKLIPVDALIRNKSLLLIDDSIVRGTQLGETTNSCTRAARRRCTSARPAAHRCRCQAPLLRLVILADYRDREDNVSASRSAGLRQPGQQKCSEMVEEIRRRELHHLRFHRLDDLVSPSAAGLQAVHLLLERKNRRTACNFPSLGQRFASLRCTPGGAVFHIPILTIFFPSQLPYSRLPAALRQALC